MREVKRIFPLMKIIADDWGYFCPDWRFGQLIENFRSWHKMKYGMSDIFYLEDNIFLERWDQFIHDKFYDIG